MDREHNIYERDPPRYASTVAGASLDETVERYKKYLDVGSTFAIECDIPLLAYQAKLYPFVNQATEPIPKRWNINDKCNHIYVSYDCLRLVCGTHIKSQKEGAAIRSDVPVPRSSNCFYYENTIIDKGRECCIGFGFCTQKVPMSRLPGWDDQSYGYHGDDGNFFRGCSSGSPYGPKFTTGDVVGCGIDFVKKEIWYTKNGHFLGVACKNVDLQQRIYASVGLKTPSECVDTNFGQKPFLFDFVGYMRDVEEQIVQDIKKLTLPRREKGIWLSHSVGSWLKNEGFKESYVKFCSDSEIKDVCSAGVVVEDTSTLSEITDLISRRKTHYARKKIMHSYPGLMETNKEFELLILIQELLDIGLEEVSKKNGKANGVVEVGPNNVNMANGHSLKANGLSKSLSTKRTAIDDELTLNSRKINKRSSDKNGIMKEEMNGSMSGESMNGSCKSLEEVFYGFHKLSSNNKKANLITYKTKTFSYGMKELASYRSYEDAVVFGRMIFRKANEMALIPNELERRMRDVFNLLTIPVEMCEKWSYLGTEKDTNFILYCVNNAITHHTTNDTKSLLHKLLTRNDNIRKMMAEHFTGLSYTEPEKLIFGDLYKGKTTLLSPNEEVPEGMEIDAVN